MITSGAGPPLFTAELEVGCVADGVAVLTAGGGAELQLATARYAASSR